MDEQKLLEMKKNNIKIYKIYRVFSLDVLFYYAVIYLFLTIEKGISPAQVLLVDAFYILFKFLFQIPCTLIIQKFGKRNSLVFANLIGIIHVLIIMFSTDFTMLVISQLLCAITFIIRSTCETDMLYDSLEHNEERGHKFAKIDGKANAIYYYVDAISAIISGFLFIINPYIPMVLCTIVFILTFVLTLKFEEIHKQKEKMHIKEEIRNIRYGIKDIFTSKRLMCMVVFNALFIGLVKIIQNIRNTALLEIGLPEQYFGVVFALLGIVTGISARNQGRIHKTFRNRTLAVLGLPKAMVCIFMGLIILINVPSPTNIILVVILLVISNICKGPYPILIKRYMNNFTNSEKRIQIATVNNMVENSIASVLIFGASFILDNVNIAYTSIIIGGIFTIAFTLLLDYMKTRVGLKPEEYSPKEIFKNN